MINVQNATILEYRYKTYCGEVDLIVIDPQKILIAVEIKQRKTIDDARYSITPQQQKRIIKSVEFFCAAIRLLIMTTWVLIQFYLIVIYQNVCK